MRNYTRHRMLEAVTTQRITFNIVVLCTSFCTYHVYKDYFSMLHDMYSPYNGSVVLRWCHKVTHTLCMCCCACQYVPQQGWTGWWSWGAMETSVSQHELWRSWGATAGVDEAPLRSIKEESEAVRTQPLILVILVSHCTLRYYLTLDCFQNVVVII